jgi:hypothetical protein
MIQKNRFRFITGLFLSAALLAGSIFPANAAAEIAEKQVQGNEKSPGSSISLQSDNTVLSDFPNPDIFSTSANESILQAFNKYLKYPVGGQPLSVALGDLDENGYPDIVTANNDSDDISILLGQSDGIFADHVEYAVGENPRSIVLGDLNGDGNLDIVTANNSNKCDISILTGNGNGIFSAQTGYSISHTPIAVVLGDVDRDGYLDIVTASSSSYISILQGNGDGTFTNEIQLSIGAGAEHLALSDLDGDGDLDIVTAISDGVSVLLGKGNGAFADETVYSVDGYPNSVALGDIDNDEDLDIITANEHRKTISVFSGNGDGTFAVETQYIVGDPDSIALGDLNKDGNLDIVTVNMTSKIAILLGKGDSSFENAISYFSGDGTSSVALGDLNVDGNLDLVAANKYSSDTVIFLGIGDGTFEVPPSYSTGESPASLASGDLDGDGNLDIVTANADSNNVSVIIGNGDSTFADQIEFAVGENPSSLALEDLDNDGAMDILTTNVDSEDLSVLMGKGDGTFDAEIRYSISGETIGLGDVNNDGYSDLIITGANSVSVLQGKGDGSFSSESIYSTGEYPMSKILVDLNSDGNLDIITSNESNDISVLIGLGDGDFAAENRYSVGLFPKSISSGDLNNDGYLDLVTANSGNASSNVSILLNQGDGTFADQTVFSILYHPRYVSVGDLDGDGYLDIVTVNNSDDMSVLPGKGDGTFDSQIKYYVVGAPYSIILGDLDGDGDLDIITNNQSDNITVLVNSCETPCPAELTISTTTLATGDVKIPYSQTLKAVNGSEDYTWSLKKKNKLPSGLKLKTDTEDTSKAVISGQPTKAATFTFIIQVTDNEGSTAEKEFSVQINKAVKLSDYILPKAEVEVAFSWNLKANYGSGTYNWSSEGEWPEGLYLDESTGEISGTPLESGKFQPIVKVKDTLGSSASKKLSLRVHEALSITDITLPDGEIGLKYKKTSLKATGGTRKYTWSIVDGALPSGLKLSPKGVFSGKIYGGEPGVCAFTVRVSDQLGILDKALTITIFGPPVISALPGGVVDKPYSQVLTATAGSGGNTFKKAGSMPSWLEFDSETATLSGTPTVAGTYEVTFKVTDSMGKKVTQKLTITVTEAE